MTRVGFTAEDLADNTVQQEQKTTSAKKSSLSSQRSRRRYPMQQIVTPDYYKDVFCGEFDGDEKELSKLLEVAYIIIYNETCGRIAQFDSLDKKVQTAVKDAICWQVDYISANGGLSFVHDGSFSNISLGSFSYSAGGNSSVSDGKLPMCNVSYGLLLSTGLMYKGLDAL